MTQINSAADFGPLISRERAGNVIGDALRLFVGRGRRYTVKQLSNATGVKDRVIECAMCRPDNSDFRPLPAEALLSVTAFLGPVFTNEWLSLAAQGAYDLPQDGDPNPGDVAIDTADDAATVTRAAMDGEFCDVERPELRVVGTRMMNRGAQLVALGRRAA